MGEADEWKTRLCKYATYQWTVGTRKKDEFAVRVYYGQFPLLAMFLVVHLLRHVLFLNPIVNFQTAEMGFEIRGVSRFSLCEKVSYARPWCCHPTHCLRLPYFVTGLLHAVLQEFPRSALFEMEVQILYLCLGTSPALDSWSFL